MKARQLFGLEFWIILVCGIIAFSLAAIVSELFWLLALLPFYIFPLFRQLGWMSVLDERAQHHALVSNSIAFQVLLFFIIILEIERSYKDMGPGYLGLIVMAVLIKLFVYVALNLRPRTSAVAIGLLCGTFWVWFAIAGNWPDPLAIIIQSLFGLLILAGTWCGFRWPYIGAAVLFVIALGLSSFTFLHIFKEGNLSTGLFLLFLLSGPPALAGGFFIYDKLNYQVEEES